MKILSYIRERFIHRYAGMRKSVAIQQSAAVMTYCSISIIVIGLSFIINYFQEFTNGNWHDPTNISAFFQAVVCLIALYLLRRNAEQNWEWIELVNYLTVTAIALWLHSLQHANVPHIEDISIYLMCFGMVIVSTMLYLLPMYSIPLLIILEMLFLRHLNAGDLGGSPYVGQTSIAFTGLCIFLTILKFREGYELHHSREEQTKFAYLDQLTGLENRRAFSEKVDRLSMKIQAPFALSWQTSMASRKPTTPAATKPATNS